MVWFGSRLFGLFGKSSETPEKPLGAPDARSDFGSAHDHDHRYVYRKISRAPARGGGGVSRRPSEGTGAHYRPGTSPTAHRIRKLQRAREQGEHNSGHQSLDCD